MYNNLESLYKNVRLVNLMRINSHNQHIRHEELRMIPLSGHLASCSDNDSKYFMFPFYKLSSDSILERKEKEKYFINKFKP